jgi:hypothetical protein
LFDKTQFLLGLTRFAGDFQGLPGRPDGHLGDFETASSDRIPAIVKIQHDFSQQILGFKS